MLSKGGHIQILEGPGGFFFFFFLKNFLSSKEKGLTKRGEQVWKGFIDWALSLAGFSHVFFVFI